jgi:Flp pilus assembly protein TadG
MHAMNTMNTKKCNHQRGVASIEMAIALPVLLLLLVATAELGRAFYQYNALTQSLRNAVRHLANTAIQGSPVIDLDDAKKLEVRNLVVYSNTGGGGDPILTGLDIADVTVSALDASHIQVTANYAYQPIFVRIPTFGATASDVDTGFTLNASTTMRAL